VELFRRRPELAPELLRDALHVAIPDYAEIRIEDSDLTQLQPTQFTADLVILLQDGKLAPDPDKRYSWLSYLAATRARYRCNSIVLVITPSEAVTSWAATPIDLGGGHAWAPCVVGPKLIPVITETEVAAREPELAVLSALAHANDPDVGPLVALAALAAAHGLEAERAVLYHDVVLATLGDAARAALENLMASGYQFQSDFAKKHQAIGRAEGKADDILRVLVARGLSISEAGRARILGTTDLALLDRWLVQAVTASRADDIFLD